MLIRETMALTGHSLFRWRGQALLIFLPWMLLAAWSGEALEAVFGEGFGIGAETLSALLILGGLAIRIHAVGHAPAGTSGRNTTGQIASRLTMSGLYSQTRNPLYLGNCMTYLGFALLTQSASLTLAMALFLVIYYERIILAEEAFLEKKFGQEYLEWAARVPVFLPRLSDWRAPVLAFSLRSAMRREYPGWLSAAGLTGAIVTLQERAEGEGLRDEPLILALVSGVFALSLGIRFLKRRTGLLNVKGR